jgi:hypothetical protein
MVAASFQSAVNIWSTLGVVGDLAFDGPLRAAPYNLYSNGTPNIIGNAFTISIGGNPEPSGNSEIAGTATVGGTGIFAGILINSKQYASYGTTGIGGPLNPTLVLPDYSIGELATMGYFVVNLPGPANVGDLVTYDPLTGNLNSITPTTKFTGYIVASGSAGAPDVLHVSTVTAGQLAVGQVISGTGVEGGTYIAALDSGTGYTGTYYLSTINQQTVFSSGSPGSMTAPNAPAPAFAASAAYITTSAGVDTLHIATLTSGEVLIGQQVFGTGVAADTVITAYGSGTGGTGTYTLNTSGQTVASSGSPEAMTGPSNLFVPNCVVDRYTTNTTGGLAVIRLTN